MPYLQATLVRLTHKLVFPSLSQSIFLVFGYFLVFEFPIKFAHWMFPEQVARYSSQNTLQSIHLVQKDDLMILGNMGVRGLIRQLSQK